MVKEVKRIDENKVPIALSGCQENRSALNVAPSLPPGVSTPSSSTSRCCGSWCCWGRRWSSWRPRQQSRRILCWRWSGGWEAVRGICVFKSPISMELSAHRRLNLSPSFSLPLRAAVSPPCDTAVTSGRTSPSTTASSRSTPPGLRLRE